MSTISLRQTAAANGVAGAAAAHRPADGQDELRTALFSSLRRRDQRRKGELYLRGLLTTRGRKSVRNMATCLGVPDEEQGLHHFIASSTWDFAAMRAALAGFVEAAAPPRAVVLQSMPILKAGDSTVGVDRWFEPKLGQTVHGQQAFGAWYVSEHMSAPVNWRLFLPPAWLRDEDRRTRADIPVSAAVQTLQDCAAETVLEPVRRWGTQPRPVLADLRDTRDWGVMDRLSAAGLPVLARISADTRLTIADPALVGLGAAERTAAGILESAKALRQEVEWADPGGDPRPNTSLAAAVRVRVPGSDPSRGRTFLLLGEWKSPHRGPSQVWITDLVRVRTSALLRLTKLTRRVARDFARTGDQVGLRDFVGRSFVGWHRHMTLASAAYTASRLPH
ncbi:transposase [Streptomyces sp. NPDC032472]|uniref:IS701 family transposase n=1 Tax=Streptomyces sp. NPDC032472 TaxID=3155018 RepID=UPI0033E9D8C6